MTKENTITKHHPLTKESAITTNPATNNNKVGLEQQQKTPPTAKSWAPGNFERSL